MTLNRSKKFAVFLVVPLFLAVGGAAAFFYVLQNATDPEVAKDITAHFAALQNEAEFVRENDFIQTSNSDDSSDRILFSTHGAEKSGIQTKRAADPPSGKKGRKKKLSSFQPVAVKPGITRIARDTYLIDAAAMDDARNNLRKYIGAALAELVEDESGPVGFRLKNIGADSYLHAVGVRNNDILIAINGHPLNSIENVTLAIASFKNATQFRLDLLRKDKKRSLYYKVIE
ncbi:MAG: hypothetical protein JXR45_17620 [Deltaproteobacteria bacterium]|nr:hypothetical protein [Deltaproteobacteria bacterium]